MGCKKLINKCHFCCDNPCLEQHCSFTEENITIQKVKLLDELINSCRIIPLNVARSGIYKEDLSVKKEQAQEQGVEHLVVFLDHLLKCCKIIPLNVFAAGIFEEDLKAMREILMQEIS